MTAEWEHKNEIEPMLPAICVSVGFLLDDHKDYVTLIQSDSETQIMGRLTIPKVAIEKRKYLK